MENMAVVRAILTSAVKRVRTRLANLEKAFYGPGKGAVQELSKWSRPVKAVLAGAQRSVLSSSHQFDEIFRQVADPKLRFTVDLYDINKVKECYRKVLDAVPHKFNDLIKDIKQIVKYLQKYCLSFYDIKDGDEYYLDTGHNYEKQRQDFQKSISDNLDSILSMTQKFKTSNLFSTDFSSFIIEIGRKSDCNSAPFLLLFPAAVESVQNACAAMMCWIDADDNYALFISNDIKDLEEKKKDTEKTAHEQLQKYHHLLFRLKQLQTDCERMTTELEKLTDRDNELTIEEECLISETNDMQVEIEMKEYRRDELIKNAAHLHPQVLYEKYSELSEDLRDLKLKLPFTKRQLAAVQYKLNWIGEKKEELQVEQKKLVVVEKEMEELEQAKQEHEVEEAQLVGLLDKARRIYVYKSSPDAVEKIFQGRPVAINKSRLPGHMDKNGTVSDQASPLLVVQLCFPIKNYIMIVWLFNHSYNGYYF